LFKDIFINKLNCLSEISIKEFFSKENAPIKNIGIIDEAVKYYEDNFYKSDEFMKNI